MSGADPCLAPATELAGLIAARRLSPVELVDAYLARIERLDGALGAYVTVLGDAARAAAVAAERAVMARDVPLGPLHGLPIAIKDLFDFKAGVRNTFGCRALADFVPDRTATYVERLEAAGAIVLGKTNTPEFGCKGTTDNLLFGPTSTPFRVGLNAGGSSGGSAAAVAAGLAALGQGTDGGGSLRIPAAWCGVVGFKATWGRVANVTRPDGFLAASPFIHSGAIGRTVGDVALMIRVMSGPHPRDPYALPAAAGVAGPHSSATAPAAGGPHPHSSAAGPAAAGPHSSAAERGLGSLRIAYSPDLGTFPVDSAVAQVVAAAVGDLASAGARVDEVAVRLRDQQELSACWSRLHGVRNAATVESFREAGVNLLGEHRAQLTVEFLEAVELGRSLSALDVAQDDILRTEVMDAFEDVFEDHDVIVCPTLAIPPVANATDGTTTGPRAVGGVPVDPAIGWCLTYPVNLTGHPAVSVPAGLDADGLPVGLQIIGRRHRDDDVLAVAAAVEQIRPWMDDLSRNATPDLPAT